MTKFLNIVGWIGTGLVFAAVAIWVATRTGTSLPPAWDKYSTYLAWAGLVCMLLYMASQWREFAAMFSRRQARFGALTVASVLIVLGILVAINYIGKRQSKRWDLTAAKQFSLSDQSRNVVAKLDAPLDMLVFAPEPQFYSYRDRLGQYSDASKQVKVEYIDPDKKPGLAQQHNVTQYGIVLNHKGRTERITGDNEQEITNAIIKVVSGQQRKLYFTAGHNEKDTSASDREGYNAITQAIGQENYAVDKVVLAQTGAVPDDATAVIVAGPKLDFFPNEIDALKKYLAKAGKVLLMLDPPDKPDAPKLTNLIALAHDWGIDAASDNIVVDASGMGQLIGADASVPVAALYPAHPITERFRTLTAYPLARGLQVVSGGVNGHTAQPFVESSQRSWAETDLKALMTGQVEMDPAKDKPGPVTIAAAVSAPAAEPPKAPEGAADDAPKPETRMAVYGDSDFVTNRVLGIAGNKDLLMNTLGWLTQQENLISIRPREAEDRRLTLTAGQQMMIAWSGFLGVPLLVMVAGVYSWWRRR